MTPHDINRTLGEFMGKDAHYFKPALCSDDLRQVLAKLTREQWYDAWWEIQKLPAFVKARGGGGDRERWLLTCDPAIIAAAVAEVVK